MALTSKYGISDPMAADIAKGVTVATLVSLFTRGEIPGVMELAVPAGALAVYWVTVHQYLPG